MNRKRGRGADTDETRRLLVDATIDSLAKEGFSGTTARSIGTRAKTNQAAIYYHFDGMEQLLVEALRVSSERRLDRYKAVLPGAWSLSELIVRIETLYAEDKQSGHLDVLAELMGGITATPELRAGVEAATRPWLTFVEEQIIAAANTVPFGSLIPAKDLADMLLSLILGAELRNKVDLDLDRSESLFKVPKLAAKLAEAFIPS